MHAHQPHAWQLRTTRTTQTKIRSISIQSKLRAIRSERSKRRFCCIRPGLENWATKAFHGNSYERVTFGYLQYTIVALDEVGRAAQPQLSNGTMHLSECCIPACGRRIVDFQQ